VGIFAPSGPGSVATTNTDLFVSAPTITNIILSAIPGTEASIAIPVGTKRFSLRARDNSKLQLAYIPLNSGTIYWTILAGNIFTEEMLSNLSSYTVYIQSNKASTVVELVSWA